MDALFTPPAYPIVDFLDAKTQFAHATTKYITTVRSAAPHDRFICVASHAPGGDDRQEDDGVVFTTSLRFLLAAARDHDLISGSEPVAQHFARQLWATATEEEDN